jgi:hypothetical protein
MRIQSILVLSLLLSGCGLKRTVLRDGNTYQTELTQYHRWATEQASFLRSFIEAHCACESDAEGPQFEDPECERAADFVLTIEARADWHRDMSLWNARILTTEPSLEPPAIPALACPLAPAPVDGGAQ